jgi:hypothetical protein
MAQINDLMFDTLRTLGYTGALPDMRYAYERDFGIRLSREVLTVTGLKSVTDAKMAYWSDASNWGLTAVENLFANDEEGTFLDFTTSQVYADTAGTTPAAVGTGIALTLDKSQGGALGPELVTNGDFSDGVTGWTAVRSTLSAPSNQLLVTGASTYPGVWQAFSTVANKWYKVDFEIISLGSSPKLRLAPKNGTGDLGSALAIADYVNTGVKTAYFRAASTTSTVFILSENSSVADFTIDNISVRELKGVHALQATSTARPIFGRVPVGGRRNLLERTEEPYQKVVTQHDITEAGVPSIYKSFFDKSDDILPVTLPTITGGTVALVGTSGIWIEDDWDFTAGTLNIGPTTIAGLPAGILSVVGDLCAVIINDRAWTAAERAGVVAWGKARGAPGVFGLGPELVTNGTFDTDTDWLLASECNHFGRRFKYSRATSLSRTLQSAVFIVGEAHLVGLDA